MATKDKSDDIRKLRATALSLAIDLVKAALPTATPPPQITELGSIVVGIAAQFEDYLLNGAAEPE